jgi:hypothetical protein
MMVVVRIIESERRQKPFGKKIVPGNFGLQNEILWTKYLKTEKSALFLQM